MAVNHASRTDLDDPVSDTFPPIEFLQILRFARGNLSFLLDKGSTLGPTGPTPSTPLHWNQAFGRYKAKVQAGHGSNTHEHKSKKKNLS